MNKTPQNAHIQVRLPGSGELCTFSVDGNTRFSNFFHALIGKGCFACPQGNILFRCFCAVIRIWSLGSLRKTPSMTDSLSGSLPFPVFPAGSPRRSISLLIPTRWDEPRRFIIALKVPNPSMGHEEFLREYKSYQVTPEQEAIWHAECCGAR